MGLTATIKDTLVHVGDTVDVHYRIIEKEVVSGKTKKEKHEEQKERIQVFEGIVIAIKGKDENLSFTVRRIGAGAIGIERIFPAVSPWIKKVVVKKKGNVRRAKLYYLRAKTGKAAMKIAERVGEKDEPTVQTSTKAEAEKESSKPETKNEPAK